MNTEHTPLTTIRGTFLLLRKCWSIGRITLKSYKDVKWNEVSQKRDRWWCSGDESSGSVKAEELFGQLNN